MIDLHCHLLPGLDDGAQTLAAAVEMAAIAAGEGVHTIVATPHLVVGREDAWGEVAARAAELRQLLTSRRISLDLHLGAEVLLDPGLPDLAVRGRLPLLVAGPYVLVELPFYSLPTYAEQVLFELQAQGLRPVLAHPERCFPLHGDLAWVAGLAERGVVMQVNATSLTGDHGPSVRQAARELLRRGLAQLIASDAHSPAERPPRLAAAVAAAAGLVGEQAAMAMVSTNPAAVVAGRGLPPNQAIARPRRRWPPRLPFGRG